MKKLRKPVLITLIILAALTGGVFYLLNRGGSKTSQFAGRIASEQSDQSEDRAYRYDTGDTAVELKLSGEDKNVLNFDKNKTFEVAQSETSKERLERVIKKKDADFEKPLIAANPFGTNENSFYFYFKTDYRGMVRYTITVQDENIPDHVRYLDNGQEKNLTTTHECIVSGLVPGMTNYIILEVLDSSGVSRDKKTYMYTPGAARLPSRLSVEKGKSKELCANGLFFLFPGSDKDIYVYDNSGILRDVIVTESGHGKRMYQFDDCMMYQVSDKKVIKVSPFGMVMGTATVSGYGDIRDFAYDGYDNIYSLVKKKGRDYLVSTSFQSGKTKKIYAFPKGLTPGSIALTMGGSAYFSCDKPDGLLYMEALTGNQPKVGFVLGNKEAWKKIVKSDKNFKKKIKQDKAADKWKTADAVLNLSAQSQGETTNMFSTYLQDHDKGTGIVFTVDGKEKKITVNSSLPTGQSGYIGGLSYEENFVISDCGSGTYTEYDKEGKVIKQFSAGQALSGLTKLSLNDLCFYTGK